jgi:uracil permease
MLICAVSIVCTLGISFSKAGAISFQIGEAKLSLSGLAVGALIGIFMNAILPGKDYKFSESDPTIKDAERWGGVKAEK